jgi:hypothetical protein
MTDPSGSAVRPGAVELAERIIEILDHGRLTTTYKYAVLLGLLDVCLEKVSAGGLPPTSVTTYELAQKVLDLYWPHTAPYAKDASSDLRILLQGGGRRDAQAEIVSAIIRFRARVGADPSAPLSRARFAAPAAFEALLRTIEWKLIEMPLPRLQNLGDGSDDFLYTIHWSVGITKRDLKGYPAHTSEFDNRILLKPGVGEHLVRLNNLLRPFILRDWTSKISSLNNLDEERLSEFLFGVKRISLEPVRGALMELQRSRCFYCDKPLGSSLATFPEVDHFIPWARYPNNCIENLVIAHRHCNGRKSDFLAAAEHVAHWTDRLIDAFQHRQLQDAATPLQWEHGRDRSLSVARALYLRLPGGARLWHHDNSFVPFDRAVVHHALKVGK